MATLRQLRNSTAEERFGFDQFVQWVKTSDATFPVGLFPQAPSAKTETVETSFQGYVEGIYKRNGIVFACMAVRQSLFAEITFRFASISNGRIGNLFGTPALDILARPWPNGTTGELATRMIQDADLAGNFYAIRRGDRLFRRNPDRMHIILSGDPKADETVEVLGYAYKPDPSRPEKLFTYLPNEVCHWSPIPDPAAEYRGMSWLTPVLREVGADGAATDHKSRFFVNGATPQVIVKTPEQVMTQKQFEDFKRKLNEDYAGLGNANKTLFLAPGADATVVGSQLRQMDFGETQGRDEARVASAAGVPAVIVGLKESMQGSSLNAGNYGQARRRLSDGTMLPLYRSGAAALETLVPAPQDRGPSRLWFDVSQVAFFREDRKDAADIQQVKSVTIKQLVDAGYEPSSVIAAVEAEDMGLLQHTGLFSVQLQPAGTQMPAPNGNQPALK